MRRDLADANMSADAHIFVEPPPPFTTALLPIRHASSP